jgi:hypothetical protein
MNLMLPALWTAGGIQFAIATANIVVPKKLNYRENLSRLSPVVRKVFITHSFYIVGVILFFAVMTICITSDLDAGNALARFVSAFISEIWLCRVPVQLFYYRREIAKQHPVAHWAFIFSALFLAAVYGLTASGLGS